MRLKELARNVLPEGVLVHLQALDHWLRGERELRLLGQLCPAGKVALDVGANIGSYTYFLRRYAGRVYAYEPNPDLAARLHRLFPDVEVRAVAVSDRVGEVTLKIPFVGGRADHERATLSGSLGDEEVVSHVVPAVTIDSEALDGVGFLKVDVEQHELQVLRGALGTVERCRPNIMTEATPLLYESGLIAAFSFLTALGYEGWFGFQGRFRPFAEFNAAVHANPDQWGKAFVNSNVFFFPREHPPPPAFRR